MYGASKPHITRKNGQWTVGLVPNWTRYQSKTLVLAALRFVEKLNRQRAL
jgi:hypothetical protein